MDRPISRGFRLLAPESVSIERLAISIENGPTYEGTDSAPDWTYYQGVQATVSVVTEAGLLQQLGLAADAVLTLAVGWSSSNVPARGVSDPVALVGTTASAVIDIPAGVLGGTLYIESKILVGHLGSGSADPLAPSELGAIVWTERRSVHLEGIAARLSILPVGLGSRPFYDFRAARWAISVDSTDLEAPIDAMVRVFVNEGNEMVRQMLDEPNGDVARALTSSLQLDIQRHLVATALSEDSQFDEELEYREGSLGATMKATLGLFDDGLEELRMRAEYDRTDFDVEVQGRLGSERLHD